MKKTIITTNKSLEEVEVIMRQLIDTRKYNYLPSGKIIGQISGNSFSAEKYKVVARRRSYQSALVFTLYGSIKVENNQTVIECVNDSESQGIIYLVIPSLILPLILIFAVLGQFSWFALAVGILISLWAWIFYHFMKEEHKNNHQLFTSRMAKKLEDQTEILTK